MAIQRSAARAPVRNARAKKPAPASTRSPALEKSDARREQIVRATAPLFLKKGYDNVSINEIIDLVGGSKATIYAWFGGKEGLFEAVVTMMCHEVAQHIDLNRTGPIEEQATRIGRSFLDLVLSPHILEFHRLMVSMGRTFPDKGRLFFQTGPATAYRAVAEWIAFHQQGGRIMDGDAYQLAVLFLDMLIGEHQLGWLTTMPHAAKRDKIEEKVKLAAHVFLKGCAKD